MQQLGQYVVTLMSVSLISGILLSFFREGAVRSVLRISCGVFLTMTALSPLTNLTIPNFSDFTIDYLHEGNNAAVIGKEMADAVTLERIEDGLETYILDKAAAIGCDVAAKVTVSNDGYPEAVQLWGAVSPEQKQIIQKMITNDLGITEANQQWSGEN